MQPLAWLAAHAQERPGFLAAAMADYARSAGLADDGLAATLGCDLDALVLLRLCLRPRPEPEFFRTDVEQIAHRFNVSADVVAAIVRRSDALTRLRQPAASEQGLLMAARDRETSAPEAGSDAPE